MIREEAEKYIKSKMCNNCGVYLGGGKCSDNCKVIEAIKALEQEPNNSENPTGLIEIKVGDEVTVAGANGIVVREPYPIGSDNELFVLVWYGQYMSSNSLKNVAPTGRHFPQIIEVLEQLRRSCC